jgi:hypothetical protein
MWLHRRPFVVAQYWWVQKQMLWQQKELFIGT